MWSLIIIIIILSIIYFKINNSEYKRKISKLKCEFALPILGHVTLFANVENLLPSLERMWVKYGYDKFIVKFGPIEQVVLTKPEDVEVVLSSYKHMSKNIFYKDFENVFGPSTITYPLNKWLIMRRNLTPVFNTQKFDGYLKVFHDEMNDVLSIVKNQTEVDTLKIFLEGSLRMMCRVVLGSDFKNHENYTSYFDNLYTALQISSEKTFTAWKAISVIYNLTAEGKKLKQCVDTVRAVNKTILDSKRNYFKRNADKLQSISKENFNQEFSMVDHLAVMKTPNGEQLPDEDILNEITFLIIAGVETVAAAISFTLYNLAIHQEIQEKVYIEQFEITNGNLNDEITYKDTVKMKYLELVLKESMRIHTPAPLFGRKITENTTLPDGTELEMGTNVLMLPYLTHRNPKLFENPAEFNPDRFKTAVFSQYIYFPFCSGPRNCIGLKMSMVKVKFIIAMFLRRFSVSHIGDHPKLIAQPLLSSSNGVKLKCMVRSGND